MVEWVRAVAGRVFVWVGCVGWQNVTGGPEAECTWHSVPCLTFTTVRLPYPTVPCRTRVQVAAGYVLHVGEVAGGEVKVGDAVTVRVDYDRRGLIKPNHTFTHVLNYALKWVARVCLKGHGAQGQGGW